MTKYVVNSGGVRNSADLGRAFFAEIVAGLGASPKILICLFAQPREVWEQRFSSYCNDFGQLAPAGVAPTFELALPDSFVSQVAAVDALMIQGGDDHLAQHWLKQYDLPRLWADKVVATTSAGSDALARHFWTGDWRQAMDGLGILPIKFLPHYKSNYGLDDARGPIDWEAAKRALEGYGEAELPVYALKEGEYEVFER